MYLNLKTFVGNVFFQKASPWRPGFVGFVKSLDTVNYRFDIHSFFTAENRYFFVGNDKKVIAHEGLLVFR